MDYRIKYNRLFVKAVSLPSLLKLKFTNLKPHDPKTFSDPEALHKMPKYRLFQ